MIEFSHVTVGYGDVPVLQDVSFTVPKGYMTAIVGPNGCGKTTLLRTAARQLAVTAGTVNVAGRATTTFTRTEFARTVAFMPQVRTVPEITVQRLVAHGRFPYLGLSRKMRPDDHEAVRQAMEVTGVTAWASRDLRELSGGERQRVYIAMAIAQGTPVIFLDEPTIYLDLKHQFELLELLRTLCDMNKTIVTVLHDLALALRYSDHLALIEQGQLVSNTTPAVLAASGQLERVFGIRLHQADGEYFFTPNTNQT